MKRLIVVADWAADTLSCHEVRTAVEGYLKNHNGGIISFIHSTSSTIHTAFLLVQIVEIEERFGKPLETVIFQNTDPRLHTVQSLKNSEGAKPLIIRLQSGIYLTGPDASFNFSLIKDRIEKVYEYKGIKIEGQFHSRDLYARISAHLMDEMEDEMEFEEISSTIIPKLDDHYVAHIDSFGNIKTLIPHSFFKGKFEYGELVSLTINSITHKAKYVTNLFGGQPGELVIYPGSSGRLDDRLLEISIWRHFTEKNPTTGMYLFNNPKPGMEIKISN